RKINRHATPVDVSWDTAHGFRTRAGGYGAFARTGSSTSCGCGCRLGETDQRTAHSTAPALASHSRGAVSKRDHPDLAGTWNTAAPPAANRSEGQQRSSGDLCAAVGGPRVGFGGIRPARHRPALKRTGTRLLNGARPDEVLGRGRGHESAGHVVV